MSRKVVRICVQRGKFSNASRDIRLISGCGPAPENVKGLGPKSSAKAECMALLLLSFNFLGKLLEINKYKYIM